jgi:hypothetical protein
MGISDVQLRWRRGLKCIAPLLLCAVLWPSSTDASEIRVLKADTRLVDGVYRLNAVIDYDLTTPVREALLNGVELVFDVEIAVLQDRMWWWDSGVAGLDQSYRLSYHALSRQFLVENLNTGVQRTFTDLSSALRHQGILRELPLIDASLLDKDYGYTASLRAQLALSELPLPIRMRAYLSPAWRLGSGWYTWELS